MQLHGSMQGLVLLLLCAVSCNVHAETENVLVMHASGTSNPSEYIAQMMSIFQIGSRPTTRLTYR